MDTNDQVLGINGEPTDFDTQTDSNQGIPNYNLKLPKILNYKYIKSIKRVKLNVDTNRSKIMFFKVIYLF